MKADHKQKGMAIWFLLPSLLLLGVFMFYPMIKTILLSFFEWNFIKPTKAFVMLDNYIALFKDPIFPKVLGNTFLYILILVTINFALPYLLSFILQFKVQKYHDRFKATIFLPSVISLVVGSILYLWILNPISGPMSMVGQWLGIQIPIWSKTEGLVVFILSLITSWKIFGYNFLVLYTSVMGIPISVIEVAKMDNISDFRIFWDIILPMSSATGIYVFVITIVQGLQYVFTPIKVITQGGPNYASSNLTYQSYHEVFVQFRVGHSAAYSTLTLFIFAVLLYIEYRFVEKRLYYEN